MRFDDLDARMRIYETFADTIVPPGLRIVARLDGRSFTRLTKEDLALERPFDAAFRDMMTHTAEHLMTQGMRVTYGYTQSDEISLLFHPLEDAFGRKTRKLLSILAGEASGAMSVLVGRPVSFDCRLSQLPSVELVIDYFRWRQEDAHRNALNGHCYWLLRRLGSSANQAHASLAGLSIAAKNELLFQHGTNFNELPTLQKRGVGLTWANVEKPGHDPRTGTATVAHRRVVRVDHDLPLHDAYGAYIGALLVDEDAPLAPSQKPRRRRATGEAG